MIKNFRLSVLIRILIISVLITLLVYFLLVDVRYLRSVYIVFFLVIAIIEFIWYVDKTNRDFTSFLLSLLQEDFTTTFQEKGKGKSFKNLYGSLNKITKKFEQISSAKEVQHLYLEALVDHLRVGIISFDKNGKIQMMNQALQKMFDRPQMAFLSNLSGIDERLPELLMDIKPKENKLLKVKIKDELLHLSIHASEFLLDKEFYKLISIQNIKNELDSNELDAWQKLIRVLTHEIMNSVTPITSLSGTLKQIVETSPHDNQTIDKVTQGLEAIQLRSKGLQNFTDAYRKLTKIPTPNYASLNLHNLFKRILILVEDQSKDIEIKLNISEDIEIMGDKDLLEQVFINLVKNGIEALEGRNSPVLRIKAWQDDQTHISISDNGSGIDEDKIDKIFIPFFTTKKEGSGIGLALSRQIIRLHNGNIGVTSVPGEGTSFTVSI
ncbi:sensor histidine kinase [Fulvivirga lutimaris]|uniref:sensor histidine kinase n=1 Tax=Fulvivirga lutimaris TaxID=1819566 RepID=UPI0012BC302B|nr:ATP-binding protein [Fulvivirga lutimaris]MTI40407.1 GHKL domain-containing protein [Fulvivirga lutimaris]